MVGDMKGLRLSISLLLISLSLTFLTITPTLAISPISHDPQGFNEIKWGTPLHTLDRLSLIDLDDRTQTYRFKDGSLKFANTNVESLHLLSIDGKFARVMIRYQGEHTHTAIMQYLTTQFGPVNTTRGSMVRGLNQENTWRGNETEINLNYRGHGERGFILIQSRILAPRFLEMSSDHSH